MTATPDVFDKLRYELNQELVSRETEIDVLILAFLSRSHIVALGSPGTGKSALVDRAMARIDGATQFATMLMRDMDTSAIFGPLSLAGLKDDKRVRAAGPWLHRAHFGFVDECFKGNATVLNGLLKLMYERRFEENGVELPVPLITLMGASNEMPDMAEGLAAMWDRWHFRLMVDPVTDPRLVKRMLATVWDPAPQPVLSLADLEAAQVAAKQTPVSDEAVDALIDIVTGLRRDHGIEVTGRKTVEAKRIASYAAWLAGASEAGVEHLEFLQHMLWDNPDQRRDVTKAVLAVASPLAGEIQDLVDNLAEQREKHDEGVALEEGDPKRAAVLSAAHGKTRRAAARLVEIESELGGRSASHIAAAAEVLDSLNVDLQLAMVPGLPPAAVESLVAQARAGTLRIR